MKGNAIMFPKPMGLFPWKTWHVQGNRQEGGRNLAEIMNVTQTLAHLMGYPRQPRCGLITLTQR